MTATTANAMARPGWPGAGLLNRVALVGLILPFTASALQVGTGGIQTATYYRERGEKGYLIAQFDASDADHDRTFGSPTPSENLVRIRSILKPTVTELARILGVSRQAVYDWQSGGPIMAENAAKLADLAGAADVFAVEGLTTTHQILRRQIAGRSFFDRVRDGEPAEETARSLLRVVRRELEQRWVLEARLRGRKKPPLTADDIGLPHLSEEG